VGYCYAVEHGVPDGVAAKLRPVQRYGLRVALFIAAVSLTAIPFGLLLEQVATDGPLTRFDLRVAERMHHWFRDKPAAVRAFELITQLGKPIVLVVVVGLPALWLLRNGARKLFVFLAVTCIGGSIVDSIVKVAVGRSRPVLPDLTIHAMGKSFPSGHSMSSTVCFGALYLTFAPVLSGWKRRVALVAAIALPLLVGVSRLVLGVHFLSDVVGGWVLGAAWLLASVAAFEIWREERGRRRTEPAAEGVEPEEGPKLVERPL
jgi:undecaprenyl-diphosphatase